MEYLSSCEFALSSLKSCTTRRLPSFLGTMNMGYCTLICLVESNHVSTILEFDPPKCLCELLELGIAFCMLDLGFRDNLKNKVVQN